MIAGTSNMEYETNVEVSAAEISDGSISSEGEPPIRKLYRKPCVKKYRFGAKNRAEHPKKIYGVNNKIQNGVITIPPQPNGQPQGQIEDIGLSSAVVPRGPSEVSAWNLFIVPNKLFSQCCETITWVWNRCGPKAILPENTTNEVMEVQEDGETEF